MDIYDSWVRWKMSRVSDVPDYVLLYGFATSRISKPARYLVPHTKEAWMVPLCKVYSNLEQLSGLEADDLREACLAGFRGDFEAVERYVGGIELATAK